MIQTREAPDLGVAQNYELRVSFKVLFSNTVHPFTFRVNPCTSDMTQFYILIQLYVLNDTLQKTTFIKNL